MSDSKSAWKKRQISKGLCRDCRKPRGQAGTKTQCRPCADKRNLYTTERTAKIRAARASKGLCIDCEALAQKAQRCIPCHTKARDHWNKNRSLRQVRRKAEGLCPLCGRAQYHQSSYCQQHYIEMIARKYSISGDGYSRLIERLEEQEFRCTYTGQPIVPGLNACLDHITPRNGKKDVSGDPSNLVWCDSEVNRMKGSQTAAEFIDICRRVAALYPSEG